MQLVAHIQGRGAKKHTQRARRSEPGKRALALAGVRGATRKRRRKGENRSCEGDPSEPTSQRGTCLRSCETVPEGKRSSRSTPPPHTHSASIDCAGKAERLNSTPKSLTSARAGRTRWRMDATCAREIRAQGRHARESPLRSRLAELARCAAENVPRDLSAYPQCRAPAPPPAPLCMALALGTWEGRGPLSPRTGPAGPGAEGRPAARARGRAARVSIRCRRTERCLGSGRRAGGQCRVL